MQVDKRVIEPFNAWWRSQGQHGSPQSLWIISAFEAGFLAALEEVRKARSQSDGGSDRGV